MASETDIANMALAHLKQAKRIGNLRTEKSTEATVCLTFFDLNLDQLLRDFDWPFATKIANLGLVTTLPNQEWGYSYRYPSDCVNFRKIQSGVRVDSNFSGIPFRVSADNEGRLIFADLPGAVGEWTFRVTNIDQWPADAAFAFSLLHAASIAPALTGSDPFKLGAQALQKYQQFVTQAQVNSANEVRRDRPAEAEGILVRDYDSSCSNRGWS